MDYNPHKIMKNDRIRSSSPLFYISMEKIPTENKTWKSMEFYTTLESVLQKILSDYTKSQQREIYLFVFRLHDEVSFSEEEILMIDDELAYLGSVSSFLIPYSKETPFVSLDLNVMEPISKLGTFYHPSFCNEYTGTENFWDISLKRKIQWLFLSKSPQFNSILLISQLKKFYKGYHGSLMYDSDSNWFLFYHLGFLFYFHGDVSSLTDYMERSSFISNILLPPKSSVVDTIHHLDFRKIDSKDLTHWDAFENKSKKNSIDLSEVSNSCNPQTLRVNKPIQLNIKRKTDLKIPEILNSGFIIPEYS